MIRFITATEHITLSPFDITGVFVNRLGPCVDFSKTKPFKHYSVSIETSDKVYDFEYQILSNFFEKFEDEFCNGIVEDINDFITKCVRVFQEHKLQGYTKLDIDDVVYRNLNDTNFSQINAITNTSIIIEGIQEIDNPEYTDDDDNFDDFETQSDENTEKEDICMCPDCEAEFERQIAPYIKKVIIDMKSKKEI